MPRDRSNAALKLGMIVVFALGLSRPARAHDGHDHKAGPHGGAVEKTKHYQLEVVFAKDGLKVYPYAEAGSPLDASRLTGKATFYHPGSPKPWFDRPLRAAAASLDLAIDLGKVPATGVKVAFEVNGLPDPAERVATFTVPFTPTGAGQVVFAKATKADEKAIAAQKVCLVSREPLGSMGMPIKATRGAASTFLCCATCEEKVLVDPDKYLPAGITSSKATEADQKAIAAQKVCPVSGEALGSMGGPIKVTSGSRTVFLCCAACLKTVQADPGKYLGPAAAASGGDRGR